MHQLIITLMAIALSVAALYTTVSYINPTAGISRDASNTVEAGFRDLSQALLDYNDTVGHYLPPAVNWTATLTPAYTFMPRAPLGMTWDYGLSGGAYYLCLTGNISEAQYKGLARYRGKVSAQQFFVSSIGCAAQTNSTAPTTWPSLTYATYWVTPY